MIQVVTTIFNNIYIRARFGSNKLPNAISLGDSSYPVRAYFFTPIANSTTRIKHCTTNPTLEGIVLDDYLSAGN
jgi:hypothetical protein